MPCVTQEWAKEFRATVTATIHSRAMMKPQGPFSRFLLAAMSKIDHWNVEESPQKMGVVRAFERHAGHRRCELHSLGLVWLAQNYEAKTFEKRGFEPIESDDADVTSAVKSWILLRRVAKGFTRVPNLS